MKRISSFLLKHVKASKLKNKELIFFQNSIKKRRKNQLKRPLSSFGKRLQTKKALEAIYGKLSIPQWKNIISKKNKPKVTSFFLNLERRLDRVICQARFASSSNMARQWILHEKIFVNNQLVTYPGTILKNGDIISLSPDMFSLMWSSLLENSKYRTDFKKKNFFEESEASTYLKKNNLLDHLIKLNSFKLFTNIIFERSSSSLKRLFFLLLKNKNTVLDDFLREAKIVKRKKVSHLETSYITGSTIFLHAPAKIQLPLPIEAKRFILFYK
uniref:Ribosomal protein S4 n=1 Tax=Mesostigma viride TaxID=41882 RepID=Q8W9R0_MESVI|nr:ribosomal protein S4 [Mesostigma viride]AAL36748.1 ribosomal protein S4 [Mesostigma viride]